MTLSLVKRAVTVLALVGAAGCGDDDCCEYPQDAAVPYVEVAAIPYFENPLVDIMFVLDDSLGGLEMQTGIKNAFPAFIAELAAMTSGLPSMHIGVVSTDVGVAPTDLAAPGAPIGTGPGSCADSGKDGQMQTNGADLMGDVFIDDTRNSDGTRTVNFSQSLDTTFATIASLGGTGCGFEQPLHAMYRALRPSTNLGFRRTSANLALVFVTDEDDCSFSHSSFLGPDDATLGPLASFRCTRFGVTCDTGGTTPDEMNTVGVKESCHSNEQSSYIKAVKDYTDWLRITTLHDYMVSTTVVATRPSPVEVRLQSIGGGTPMPALASTCTYSGGGANAGVRLDEFAASFPRNIRSDICTDDYTSPLVATARMIRHMSGDRCVGRPIPAGSDCILVAVRGDLEEPLEGWSLVADPVHCTAEGNLAVELELASPPPSDTFVSLRCRL